MPLVTPAQVREHVETDLGDDAITRVIASEEAAIVARYGEGTTTTELHLGGTSLIVLRGVAASITAISDASVALTVDEDYTLESPTRLRHLAGTFAGPVLVTYVPVSTAAQRTMALIDLVKLQLAYSGFKSQGGADLSESPLDLTQERENILSRLAPRRWTFA